jgi:SAM-dependent methyltransferase
MNKVFDEYATYYDLIYQEKDYAGEAAYVQKRLSEHAITSGTILELGCGTGRHAEHLARMGFSVHGVDKSQRMVESANACKPHELAGRLTFEVGDLRTMKTDRKFEAAISLFHVASYQTTNDNLLAMFKTVSAHLKPGGVFLFDFWYGPAVLTDLPSIRIKRMRADGFDILRIAEPTMHPNRNLVDVNYTILITRHGGGKTKIFHEKHPMRYLFLPEIKYMTKCIGMGVIASYDWLTTEELSAKSWYGVILCKKG